MCQPCSDSVRQFKTTIRTVGKTQSEMFFPECSEELLMLRNEFVAQEKRLLRALAPGVFRWDRRRSSASSFIAWGNATV